MTIVTRFIGGFPPEFNSSFWKLGSKDNIALANAQDVKRYSAAKLGKAIEDPDLSQLLRASSAAPGDDAVVCKLRSDAARSRPMSRDRVRA